MDISQFFIKGDIRGAMEYMKGREEFKDILQNMSVPKAREYTRMIDDFLRVHYYKGNTMEKLGGCVRHNINS